MNKQKLIAFIMMELILYYAIPAGLFFLSNNLVQNKTTYLINTPLIGAPAAYYLLILCSLFFVFLFSIVYAGMCCQIKYSTRERMSFYHLV